MTPAIKILNELKVRYKVREYQASNHEKNYGLKAAEALQQDPLQVYKTLVAVIDGNQRKPSIALIAVANQLDLKKMATSLGGRKAVMAEPALAQKTTGYVVGGISPIGQRQLLPTVIDQTACAFESIFVSAGKRGVQLEVNPDDLIRILKARYAEISR